MLHNTLHLLVNRDLCITYKSSIAAVDPLIWSLSSLFATQPWHLQPFYFIAFRLPQILPFPLESTQVSQPLQMRICPESIQLDPSPCLLTLLFDIVINSNVYSYRTVPVFNSFKINNGIVIFLQAIIPFQ